MKLTGNSAGILGTGYYLPEKVLTNADLEKIVETSDQWIVERTGIAERHIAPAETPVSDLAVKAAQMALADAGMTAEELDLIILATVSGDAQCPSTSCVVQDKLGAKNAAAFDVNAACSGFVYASVVAEQFIRTGMYKHVLVIGCETLSKHLDWRDRNTCILFGDGAGAAIYGPVAEGYGILSSDIGSEGQGAKLLGIKPLTDVEIPEDKPLVGKHCVHMDGKEVFKFAVRALGSTLKRSLERAGLDKTDIDWLVPHQANIRIIQSAAKRFALPPEKVVININKTGNVSAASIPMALAEAAGAGRFKKGDIVALAGFGAGLTWASCIMRWAKEDS